MINNSKIKDKKEQVEVKNKKERKPSGENIDTYGRLQNVSVSEKKFLDDAVYEATKVKGKKLTKEERRKISYVARKQIRSQRIAVEIKKRRDRDRERYTVEFVWKRPEPFRR
ncbi:hypothetical protein [Raoultella ornithinolytica]|uniref:hypothetical protein n=1 Tax=Raoultella ornithinolytica TaxID=54291 RepID=UPI000FEC1502|nr:hypothetical protein [Raoultella ornithinolytica]EJG2383980.1 hypothetical protein [Raoultella ornithinolytica]RWS92592.1 hypothetical protein DN592_30465 [Raoultella ornithinolytica]